MKYYENGVKGGGLVNSIINRLPVELHIPGYNFCGPGTKLEKRLARGDRGINPLDESCRKHDIAYASFKNITDRHQADKILANEAMTRFREPTAKIGERLAALGVAGIMKTKVRLGMGLKRCKLLKNKNGKLIDLISTLQKSLNLYKKYILRNNSKNQTSK